MMNPKENMRSSFMVTRGESIDRSAVRRASTPTANYFVKPMNKVCPGRLSRDLPKELEKGIKLNLPNERIYTERFVPNRGLDDSSKWLTLTPSQGIVEIRIDYLDLSETGYRQINNIFRKNTEIKIAWKFLTFKQSSTGLKKCTGMHFDFEFSVLYKVDIDDVFFNYASKEMICFELCVIVDRQEEFIAKGEVSLKDVIMYPQEKIFGTVDLCDIDKALLLSNTSMARMYGSLTYWIRLECELDAINTLRNKMSDGFVARKISSPLNLDRGRSDPNFDLLTYMSNLEDNKKRPSTFTRVSVMGINPDQDLTPTDSEYNSFQEALDLVLSRNKALRTTQSEISNELHDRARWLHEEAKWRRTLQEYTILHGGNPDEVNWRQWRDQQTTNVKLRNYPSKPVLYEPKVTIKIHSVKLFRDSHPMTNPDFVQFYVEFSFLSYAGSNMETPFCVPKNETGKLSFNYEKSFDIDMEKNASDCACLADMISNEERIKFAVISEPLANEAICQSCQEIGHGEINMFEVVQLEENSVTDELTLKGGKDNEEIGYMKITISGILAMRRAALKLLAPSDYNIIC